MQRVAEETKPIAATFALIGLYLHVERGYSGREVQRAHMKLARRRKIWPRFEPPDQRGDFTVSEVMATPPGRLCDEAIDRWCAAVWKAWRGSREQVRTLVHAELDREGGIQPVKAARRGGPYGHPRVVRDDTPS